MDSPSFGFSVSGTKEQVLKQLADISTDGRPSHAAKILDLTKQIADASADKTTLSITINTHVEA